jgi:hypothetical protein
MNTVSYSSGFRVGCPTVIYTQDKNNNDNWIEKKEYPPETEFLEATGSGFKLTLHRCSPHKKEYLIDPNWRNLAMLKIEGVAVKILCQQLDSDKPRSWSLVKEFEKDSNGKDTETLSAISVNLRQVNLNHVFDVVAKECKLDSSVLERLYSFLKQPFVSRETTDRIAAFKAEGEKLWQSVAQAKIGAGDCVLIADLMKKEPSEKRNIVIKNALIGFYGDFTSPSVAPKLELINHLNEIGCSDLANLVSKGRYDAD